MSDIEVNAPAEQPTLDKLAYTIQEFCAVVSLSDETIRQQINAGKLIPSYVNSKPLITREEAVRWLRSLPAESSRRAS